MIKCYDDFVKTLLESGFSMGSGNSEGIYSIISWNWNEEPTNDTPVRWHTGDRETDPWEWRMRVLNERDDIAYAKLFLKKSGYITKQWYPFFLAARRGGKQLGDEYLAGKIDIISKRVYEVLCEHGALPVHAIKQLLNLSTDDKGKFDRAITNLQMGMYITMCGAQQKLSQLGMEYGWSSTVFCTAEQFWGKEVFKAASELSPEEAYKKISQQILSLNPNADEKKIKKFILG